MREEITSGTLTAAEGAGISAMGASETCIISDLYEIDSGIQFLKYS